LTARERSVAVGVDLGATLAKLVVRDADGELHCEFLPADAHAEIAARVAERAPSTIGLSGCGAQAFEQALDRPARRFVEFEAWAAGSRAMLSGQGVDAGEPYLLVSVGTGTSVMLADGMAVQRVGGTALGGGTLVGLGAALLATQSFSELTELAREGDRRSIDLMVSDIYRPGEIALAGDLTAANLGKLAERHGGAAGGDSRYRADLAHGLMALIGENVALVCAGFAAALQVRHLVFGGSTLRGNPALTEIVGTIAQATGSQVQFLTNGEFAGALGALLLAES